MNPISFKSKVFINTEYNKEISPMKIRLIGEQFEEDTPSDNAKIIVQPMVTDDKLDKISYYNKDFSDDLYIDFSRNINDKSVQTAVYQLKDIVNIFEARKSYDDTIKANDNKIFELKQRNNNIKKTKRMITEILLRQNQTKGNEFWREY